MPIRTRSPHLRRWSLLVAYLATACEAGAAADSSATDTEETGSSETESQPETLSSAGASDDDDDDNDDDGGTTEGGETSGGESCMAHQLSCSGACIIPATDSANCGQCGRACEADELCSEGSCLGAPKDCTVAGAMCPSGYFCDLGSGECQLGCAFDDQCPQPGECDLASHTCGCSGGTLSCDGLCVPQSVSACGSGCEVCDSAPASAAPICQAGSCGFVCDGGFHACDSNCVSNDAVEHCGSACSPCPDVANASETCDGSGCGFDCDAGYHPEDGGCVADCGAASCGDQEVCDPDSGACVSCPDAPSETEPNDTLEQADTIPGTSPFFGAGGNSCLEGDIDVWTLNTSGSGFWALVPFGNAVWNVEIRQGGNVLASEQCSSQLCDPGGTLSNLHFAQPVEFYVTHLSGGLPQQYGLEFTQ